MGEKIVSDISYVTVTHGGMKTRSEELKINCWIVIVIVIAKNEYSQ
jgi:hypothetical protein